MPHFTVKLSVNLLTLQFFPPWLLLLGLLSETLVDGQQYGTWTDGAHATYYGGADASGTWGGHCGYAQAKLPRGNLPLPDAGYGTLVAAGSQPLWKGGLGCGACYEVRCVKHAKCKAGATTTVTITDECPVGGGWCAAGKVHFDLSQPAFARIADLTAGGVPTQYRRIPCQQRATSVKGGINIAIKGSDFWMTALLWNVGGPGTITKVEAQDINKKWSTLKHDWGAFWTFNGPIKASSGLTFRATNDFGQQILVSGCAPGVVKPTDSGTWYQCKSNFVSVTEGADDGDDVRDGTSAEDAEISEEFGEEDEFQEEAFL